MTGALPVSAGPREPASAKRRINLLLLVTQSQWGGAQRYVHDLAVGLSREQYDITVAAGVGGPLFDMVRSHSVRTWEIPSLVREIEPINDLRALLEVRRGVAGGRFDIVHANSTKAGFVGRLAAWSVGVPAIVYTVHGLILNEELSAPRRAAYWAMEKIAGRATDAFIAVSLFDEASLLANRITTRSKVHVIYPGIDAFSVMKRPQGSGPVIGCIANLLPTKGLSYLIEAFALLANVRPELQFVLVGEGPLEPLVRSEVYRLGLQGRLTLVKEPTEGRKLLGAMDVMVLSSLKEGLPYTVSEAMLAGTPVVATAVGGVPEQIVDGETGLLVVPRDSRALASAIERLLDDSMLRKRVSAAAVERAREHFSVSAMLAATDRLYRSLLSEGVGSGSN